MDLDALMNALQATQQKKSSVRLSDRNVVELVNKLKQLGYLGDELLYTMNGKEYITMDRLRTDIERALQQAGGRLELLELPALVGVDLVHCERQAAAIVSSSKGTVLEAQGELLTTSYFDSLAAEINDLLQESGAVNLAELAISYSLNTELLLNILTARIGKQLQGKLEAGMLYTPAYVRNIKAQLRGGLRAAAAPVGLTALVKELGVAGGGTGGGGSMVAQLVEELVGEGALSGSLKPGAGSWVPAVFTRAQQGSVQAFYQQNGWVGYDTLRKAGIPGDKAYCKATFPDGLALDSVCVGPALLAQLEVHVEDALAAGGWIDAAGWLPSAFSEADVAGVLAKCSAVATATGGGGSGSGRDKKGGSAPRQPTAQVLAGTCVVAQSLLDVLQEAAVAAARAEADAAIAERRKTGASATSSSAAPGLKKTVSFSDNTQGGDDSEEDWSMGSSKKGKKGKGGGGKGGKGGGSKAAKGGGGNSNGSSSSSKGEAASVGLQQEALTDLVAQQQPDMEGAGVDGGLPEAVAALLHAPAMSAYQDALAAAFTAGADARRRAKEAASRALEEGAMRLQLYQKGAELLQDDTDQQAVVVRHMLRTAGAAALDALLAWCQQEFTPDSEGAAAAQQLAAGSSSSSSSSGGAAGSGVDVVWFSSPAARLGVVGALPKELSGPVGLALEALNGIDMQEFFTHLEAAAGECGMRLKRLDKKSEKAALAAQKARMLGLLANEASPAAALALVVPLLVLVHCHKLVTLPGRSLSAVLDKLKDQLPEEQYKLLSEYHVAVVASLKAQGAAGSEPSAEAQQLQEHLASNLEALRALPTQSSGTH